ncbi:MAG: DedA family protein [bacterium]|nr:DedA family protein [bacterium]
METLGYFIDFFLHLDKHLDVLIRDYGIWSYLVLFLIVFCETGLVVTPILPGDSLLFAAGALAGRGGLNVHLLALGLVVAAILGDAVNYMVGHYIGPKVFERKNSKIFRPEYLAKTQKFYDKYGGKTIIIARFVPIVRTFAPFLAGVGKMNYFQFALYNVAGALLWVLSLTYAGYIFGEVPFVKNNFGLVILGIIIVSILPAVIEIIRARRAPAN